MQPQSAYPGGDQQGSQRVTPTGWAFRGLVLLVVAVVSGLIWHVIKPASKAPDQAHPAEPQTKYQYTPVMQQEGFQGCASVATDQIKSYLSAHPCEHLTRALYTTSLPEGQNVLVSVVTVRMPDATTAAELNSLTTKDSTGNIQDLVESGHDLPPGLPRLDNDAGYQSEQQGQLVVLGESAYYGKKSNPKDPVLKDVTKDALRKGWPQEKTPK